MMNYKTLIFGGYLILAILAVVGKEHSNITRQYLIFNTLTMHSLIEVQIESRT